MAVKQAWIYLRDQNSAYSEVVACMVPNFFGGRVEGSVRGRSSCTTSYLDYKIASFDAAKLKLELRKEITL